MTFDDVAEQLERLDPEVVRGTMFGMPCLKVHGKVIASTYGDAMVFKLVDAADREGALALSGAQLFEPMPGRRMREWVHVPATQSAHWPRLAEAAFTHRAV